MEESVTPSARSREDIHERKEITFDILSSWSPLYKKQKNEKKMSVNDADVCKICFVRQGNIAFLPCGHLAGCGICSPAFLTTKCPICRMTVKEIVRIYKT